MDEESVNLRHSKEATSLDDLLTNSGESESFKTNNRTLPQRANHMADNNPNMLNSNAPSHQTLDSGFNSMNPSRCPQGGLQQLLSSNQAFGMNNRRFEGPPPNNSVMGSNYPSSAVINRNRPTLDNGNNQVYKQVPMPQQNRLHLISTSHNTYVNPPGCGNNSSGGTSTICLSNPNGMYGSNNQHGMNGQFNTLTINGQQSLINSGSRVVNTGNQIVNTINQAQMGGIQTSNYIPSNGAQIPPGQPASSGFTFDPHKKNLIQRQLILLLHATKCGKSNNGTESCGTVHCGTMRTVLVHMSGCTDGKNCSVPHCASSKQIISHWRSCNDKRCSVCEPLRRQMNPTSSSDANYSQGPQSVMPPNSNQILTPYTGESAPSMNGISTSVMPSASSTACSIESAINPNSEMGSVAPETESDWRSSVSKGQRQHLVRRIVQTIFPAPDKSAYGDDRMNSLIEYAQKVENENYQNARSREEYFHKLAERCYKINKELEEKKKQRNARSTSGSIDLPMLPGLGNDNTSDGSIGTSDIESTRISLSTNGIVGPVTSDSSGSNEPTLVNSSVSMPTSSITRNDNQEVYQGSVPSSSTLSSSRNPETQMTGNVTEQDSLAASQFDHALKHEYIKRQSDSFSSEPSDSKKESVAVKRESSSSSVVVKTESTNEEPIVSNSNFPPINSANRSLSDVPNAKGGKATYPYLKKWSREELCRNLLALHRLISAQEEAAPFLEPVDPIALGIPDYSKIVKNPMDLGTIQRKLESGEYLDPWEVIDDFWLMFANAWLYNKKNSRVYRFCSKLAETFEKHVDKYMQSMGLCCGQNYIFQPQVLYCSTANMCSINRDANYYCYEKKNFKDLFPENNYICEKCYTEADEHVYVYVDANQPTVKMEKALFQLRKNNVKERENFVLCVECGRKWHQICALHLDEIWRKGFVCRQCLTDRPRRRVENQYVAKRLPTTKLGSFLEKRVNDFLKKKDSGAGEVTIRVLYSGDKSVEVKPMMKARFCDNGSLAEQFPYKSKAIFAFQEIDGVDVCFFGLHVQEYGSECPRPNQRRVYVAYLDSVFFFRPKQHRTDVYHEILVGYLQYARFLGYTMAHIWACPPSEGDDYIFHMHPPDQKIPKPKRLQEWYQKMLEKALIERIVTDYKDIFTDAMRNCIDSPAEIPYFEGDFWSNTLEDIIKEVDEIKAKQEEVNVKVDLSDDEDDEINDNDDTFTLGNSRRSNPNKKKPKKRKGNKRPGGGVPLKRKKIGTKTMQPREETDLLLNKVYDVMDKHKDVFFNIRLHPQQQEANMPPIEDPDPPMNSELMDGRDAFLALSREKHLEFSSLRRAKFSTMVLLYELHTENRGTFMYTCNVCLSQLHIRWHCKTCVEYDLCEKCYLREKHPHPLERIQGIKLGAVENEEGPSTTDISVQEARRNSIERCIKSLTHACQCRDANCRVNACQKMKNVLLHMRNCDQKTNGSCSLCKQLIALCCYHAKYCLDASCVMPFCSNIKYRWKQQQLQQRFVQAQNLRRRIANMQMQRDPSTTQSTQPSHVPSIASGASVDTAPHPVLNTNVNSVHQVSQAPMQQVNPNNPQMNVAIRVQPGSVSVAQPTSHNRMPTIGSNSGNPLVITPAHAMPSTVQTRIHPQSIEPRSLSLNNAASGGFAGASSQNFMTTSTSGVGHSLPVHSLSSSNLVSNNMNNAAIDDASAENMRKILQDKIAAIRRETNVQHEQNQKLQEFLTSHPAYIEIFRKMREEHQRKKMNSVIPVASHPHQNPGSTSQISQMTIRQQAPNQWGTYGMNSTGAIRNEPAMYNNTPAQPQRIIIRTATKPTNSFPPSK